MAVQQGKNGTRAVKEDPHLILNQMWALEETLNLIREEERNETRVLPVLDKLRDCFMKDLRDHMAEEEREFFPEVARLPRGVEKVARLAREHAELRERIEDFKSALTLAGYVGPQSRWALLWRLVTDARAILARLRTHAAFEYDLVREIKGPQGNGLPERKQEVA